LFWLIKLYVRDGKLSSHWQSAETLTAVFFIFGKMLKEKPMLNASTFFILWQNAKGKADAQRIDLF